MVKRFLTSFLRASVRDGADADEMREKRKKKDLAFKTKLKKTLKSQIKKKSIIQQQHNI